MAAGEAEINRYRASHFYAEIKRYFRWMGGAPKTRTEPAPAPVHPPNKEAYTWSLEKN